MSEQTISKWPSRTSLIPWGAIFFVIKWWGTALAGWSWWWLLCPVIPDLHLLLTRLKVI